MCAISVQGKSELLNSRQHAEDQASCGSNDDGWRLRCQDRQKQDAIAQDLHQGIMFSYQFKS